MGTQRPLPTIIFLLFLSGCATTTPTITRVPLEPQNTPIAVLKSAGDLNVGIHAVDVHNPDRTEFYDDFIQKGYLPLQIMIHNPTDKTYSFEHVQYAICDQQFKRTRRISPKNMAMADAQIVYEKKKRKPLFSFFGKKMAAKKLKQDYEKFEFTTEMIEPFSKTTGWFYFKVKEGKFDPKTFFDEIEGYYLEIAHIKELETNIVRNVYLELDPLAEAFD